MLILAAQYYCLSEGRGFLRDSGRLRHRAGIDLNRRVGVPSGFQIQGGGVCQDDSRGESLRWQIRAKEVAAGAVKGVEMLEPLFREPGERSEGEGAAISPQPPRLQFGPYI